MKIEKHQWGKVLNNGIKWLTKGDDVGRVVKSANTVNKLNRWSPGLITTGGGVMGGLAGYGTGLLIDNQYGTNIAPWMALSGAGLGAGLVARSSPVMMRRMMNKASKLDWTPEGIIFPTQYPSWSRSSSGYYNSGVVHTPLFARKSQLAHELGHYVGDFGVADPSKVRGAFNPRFSYSPNAGFELNSAEHFADHFKTKIGYPYKGLDPNLVARQNALGGDTQFFDVFAPDISLEKRVLPKLDLHNLTSDMFINPSQVVSQTAPSPIDYRSRVTQWRKLNSGVGENEPISIKDLKEYINSLDRTDFHNNQLYTNFYANLKKLTKSDTYHNAFTPDQIIGEFANMAKADVAITPDDIKHVQEYLEYDAMPRLLKAIQQDNIPITPDDLQKIMDLYRNPLNGIDIKLGYVPYSDGFSLGPRFIRFSNYRYSNPNMITPDTYAHELHHSIRRRAGEIFKKYFPNRTVDDIPKVLLSKVSSRNLNTLYDYLPSELKAMEALAMSPKFNVDKTPFAEIPAVLAGDHRIDLFNRFKRMNGFTPTSQMIDSMIDDLPDNILWNTDYLSYGDQIGTLFKNKVLNKQYRYDRVPSFLKWLFPKPNTNKAIAKYAESWRNAMKYIGGGSGLYFGTQMMPKTTSEENNNL